MFEVVSEVASGNVPERVPDVAPGLISDIVPGNMLELSPEVGLIDCVSEANVLWLVDNDMGIVTSLVVAWVRIVVPFADN